MRVHGWVVQQTKQERSLKWLTRNHKSSRRASRSRHMSPDARIIGLSVAVQQHTNVGLLGLCNFKDREMFDMHDMHVYCKCFLRHHFGDYLLCNLRNGATALLRDAEDFLRPILTKEDFKTVTESLARKYNVSECEILNDMLEFYQNLANLGLIEIIEGESEEPQFKTKEILQDKTSGMIDKWSVPDFYKKHNLPVELHIDLTDSCTERCVHCYVPQEQHYLRFDLVEKVLREFREQQGLTVQLSGGECLLYPQFAQVCRLCRKLDLNFIVLSNLTRCDEKIIEVLKETDPQFVNVSLYSMNAEEHDAITQIRGSWRKTMAAIDACQQAGIHIRLATPLLKVNQNAYPALRNFAEERHVHLIPNYEIIPMCNRDCSNLCHTCTPQEMESVLKTDRQFWDCDTSNPRHPDGRVCVIGERLFLNAKGQYYGCSGMNEFVIGDAIRDTVSDVWNSDMMRWLRGLKNKDFKSCMNCEHSSFCKVCPAFNYNATGSLFETIPAKCALAEVKHRVFGEK